MSETLLGVMIGGLIGLVTGFIPSWYTTRENEKMRLREKSEEAYIGLIEALNKLTVDRMMNINFSDFSEEYENSKAKVKLYGSSKLLKHIDNLFSDLDYAWNYYNGTDIDDIVGNKEKVINAIREELKIL